MFKNFAHYKELIVVIQFCLDVDFNRFATWSAGNHHAMLRTPKSAQMHDTLGAMNVHL
jgi:hypothetical protein